MKWKKILALGLSLIVAVSSAACGAGESAPAEKETDAEQGSEGKEQEDAEQESGDVPTLTLYVDETWWPYDTWEGAVPEEFEKRVGVNIEVTRAADDNQLALMVASGDMPDIVCSGKYSYLADSQVCYPLDELHTEYPDISFEVDPMFEFLNRAADGHYYTIGCGVSPAYDYEGYDKILTEGTGFMYREDIAEELGLTFTTLDDLDTAFEKVQQAYPDITVCAFSCIHQFGWLMQQMGLKNGGYYEAEDGTLKWYLRQEGLLDYYKKVNEWYRKGYLTAENFAYQSEEDTKTLCVSGQAFANFGYDAHADIYSATIADNGDDFRLKLVTDELSDKCKAYDTLAAGRGLYITRSCKDVEAAYRLLAYAYGEEGMRLLMWGMEGVDYTLDADGYPVLNYDFQGSDAMLKERGLKYWGWLVHNAIVTSIAEVNNDSQTTRDKLSLSEHVVRNPVIGMIRFEMDSEEENINTRLTEAVKNAQTNIYMADSEEACIEAYNFMIQQAEELNMGRLEEYGNEVYPELKAEYDRILAEHVK